MHHNVYVIVDLIEGLVLHDGLAVDAVDALDPALDGGTLDAALLQPQLDDTGHSGKELLPCTLAQHLADLLTEEEMWKALELAQASEVVDGKPGKLDATVAQNGKNFSGGQRQRLTIARALVRNPEILILDDSASALDYATDAKLRAAIRTLEDKTTTFIVSQRASTIRHADKIIVLDDGEIAGMGTHDELLKDCTVYHCNFAESVGSGTRL